MGPLGNNNFFKNMLKKRQETLSDKGKEGVGLTDKGKNITGCGDKGKTMADALQKGDDLVTIVIPSDQRPPFDSGSRHKKKKSKEHHSSKRTSKRSSSHRSPKRLRPSTTSVDCSSMLDFLNCGIMISNRVMFELSDSEKDPYTPSSPEKLNNAFLELCSHTLLIGRSMGASLIKKNSKNVESLKTQLSELSTTLQTALAANVKLSDQNKTLISDNVILLDQSHKSKVEATSWRECCALLNDKRRNPPPECQPFNWS